MGGGVGGEVSEECPEEDWLDPTAVGVQRESSRGWAPREANAAKWSFEFSTPSTFFFGRTDDGNRNKIVLDNARG